MESMVKVVFSELMSELNSAASVLEKCVKTGVLKEQLSNIGYIRWAKNKKDEWFYVFEPIAKINRNGNGEIVGIEWEDNIYSPAAVLEKLLQKHRKKLRSVSDIEV